MRIPPGADGAVPVICFAIGNDTIALKDWLLATNVFKDSDCEICRQLLGYRGSDKAAEEK